MKALVLEEYKRFSYKEVPTPSPGDQEVLVAVKACGICGSDVHGMDGSTGRRRPPIIMGHEASGVITKVGKNTAGWTEGDRVTFDSTIYCGECDFCRRGEINLCQRRRVLGVSCEDYRQDGAFAEFLRVPQRVLYRLPQPLAFEDAALVEPFSIAMHAAGRAALGAGDRVAVIGAGMIGLALVQVAKQMGCEQVIAVDIAPERLDLASKVGATHTVNSSRTDPGKAIEELTRGEGVTVALEAVGVTATVNLALNCVKRGGAVVLVGNVMPKIEFPLQVAVTRELSVYGSCASRGEYPKCLQWLAEGKLQAAPLISAAAPLAEGASWFDRLYRKEPGLIKVVLRPDAEASEHRH